MLICKCSVVVRVKRAGKRTSVQLNVYQTTRTTTDFVEMKGEITKLGQKSSIATWWLVVVHVMKPFPSMFFDGIWVKLNLMCLIPNVIIRSCRERPYPGYSSFTAGRYNVKV